ncbi:RNA-directed DNA polymerase, eukaryota, reverse transcriptase zinc-binding domain protein [Tanacetum coccineum]
MDQDVANAVREFFVWSKFSPGSNSSFITLIPKKQDAKAFDSVRWDYLDDILNNFGFESKWRGWIQGCLNSAMGSILVNGSPTPEFKFRKGLKQRDPLSPFLFILVGISSSRSKSWDDVLAKISSRLSKWKIKTLSIGGRYSLTKSVLSSLHLYHMSIYKVPMGVLNNIESIRRRFFNGVDKYERKMSMIGWNKILASKKKGGFGVSSFFALNRALLLKWIWRFLSHGSSLWTRFIKVMYSDRGFLDNPVGNGAYTRFWEDPWLTDSPLMHTYPWLYSLECAKHATVVVKFNDSSLFDSFRRPPRGGIKEDQLLSLVDNVVPVILSNSNDRWVWTLDSSGEFSVKTARSYIDEFFLPTVGAPTRWVKVVPIKINIFAWKVSLDKLSSRLNLSLRGIDIPSIICPICSSAGESCSHVLFSCNLARLILRKVARWWELDIPEFHSYEDWLA